MKAPPVRVTKPATASASQVLQRQCARCAQAHENEDQQPAGKTRRLQKLALGAPHDVFEQEADRVAGDVLRSPAGLAPPAAPRIQRLPTSGVAGQGQAAPASVDAVLASAGAPLAPSLRNDMQRRFGHAFSEVRVHADSAAAASAREVRAEAYTVGSHIVFGAGRFAPATQDGRRLLAHELTHVVQQGGAQAQLQRDPTPAPETQGGPPFFGMPAAPDAFSGILLEYNTKTLPGGGNMQTAHTMEHSPYSIKTYSREAADGSRSIIYYNVVRTKPGLIGPTMWTEYYVGPDAIQQFLNELQAYAASGAVAYMFGRPAPNSIEGAKFVESAMAGEGAEAAKAYGRALEESIKDPGWWVQMITAGASLVKAPVASAVPKGPPPTAVVRPPPALRLVSSQRSVPQTVVGRASGAVYATEGGAAVAVSPSVAKMPLPKPQLSLVPNPISPIPAVSPQAIVAKALVIPPAVALTTTVALGVGVRPSTRKRRDADEDNKLPKDACTQRLGLLPGINDSWFSQRKPIRGNTTVFAAAFRLDGGIPPKAGQDTTAGSQKWSRQIGLPKDDAGHVIANRFGGRANFNSSIGNIFPQDLSFNRGTMRSYDNEVALLHAKGCDVCVNIGLMYDSDGALRPSSALYTYLYRSVGATNFNPLVSALVPNP